MTVIAPRKYNPGFLSDDELVGSFCVRTGEFESIIEVLRECTGRSNTHQIVIGPRGSGKTSLLLRVAAELRREPALSSAFFPVVFAEESYEIATAGEFWLECLSRLADRAPRREGDPDLRRTFEDLRAIRDDRTLGERCLGALLDFSDRENKRLVLAVENLNMMFRDMADPDAGWRLRKVLQTEPRIVLLASATSRFDEIDNPEHALYDQFRTLTLRPLDTKECAVLWEAASGRSALAGTIRSLEILTGGSPRLLAIVARFGAGRSFRDLMADLLDLVDDHTEYFKGHLESLPAQERRVYLALADLWKPALTREIADRARLDTNKCSAQIARLIERGVVEVKGGSARRKQYYLSERLYNIYYLLRRRDGSDRQIKALIRFMASFNSRRDLKNVGAGIAREARESDTEIRALLQSAFMQLIELPALAGDREELLAMAPPEFADVRRPSIAPQEMMKPDRSPAGEPDTRTEKHPEAMAAQALFGEAVALHNRGRVEEALVAYDELASRFAASESPLVLDRIANALVAKGILLAQIDQKEEALVSWDEVVRRFGESRIPTLLEASAKALGNKGIALRGLNRMEEALSAYDEIVRRFGESRNSALIGAVALALGEKRLLLGLLNRPEEVLATCDEVVRRFGKSEVLLLRSEVARALVNKGLTLSLLNWPAEALVACDEVIHRFGKSRDSALLEAVALALGNKEEVLRALNRPEEALAVCDEVVRRFGKNRTPALLEAVAKALYNRGVTLGSLNRPEEALAAYDEFVRRFGESRIPALLEAVAKALVNKGRTLSRQGQPEEALAVYDEVVRRFGENRTPALLEAVATALENKGLELHMLDRRREALVAYDEIVRRFGENRTPALLEAAAKALFNRGVTLRALNRPEEALANYDEIVRRFGESRIPALLEAVAKALVNKGFALRALNRPEEALANYDEIVRRFGESRIPALLEAVAKALVNKGFALRALNRPEEALANYDEIVRRFGENPTPALLEAVAKSLADKGAALNVLNRPEEALTSCDEVTRRFGESGTPVLLEAVAEALVNKGFALRVLNRLEEALAVYDEVARRFGEHESPALQTQIEFAFIGKAELELGHGRHEAAIEAASRVLDRDLADLPLRWMGHLFRAQAGLAAGDPSIYERDIEAALAILPEIDPIPGENLDALAEFGIKMGAERMRELIQASPAAELLLPLTTALEWELGLKPRVAREVEEVAGDIRRRLKRRLKELREARADGVG